MRWRISADMVMTKGPEWWGYQSAYLTMTYMTRTFPKSPITQIIEYRAVMMIAMRMELESSGGMSCPLHRKDWFPSNLVMFPKKPNGHRMADRVALKPSVPMVALLAGGKELLKVMSILTVASDTSEVRQARM